MTTNQSFRNNQTKIDDIEITDDTLTSRGGLSLFARYLRNVEIYPAIENIFGRVRKSRKGGDVCEIFKQLFCFFMDGTSRHLSHFDHLKRDGGYAGSIETTMERMQSTSSVKRFFRTFSFGWTWTFRSFLRNLFMWRLKLKKPSVIVLGVDTMVMDNDEALQREGCNPTYKKKKGFQPLQMTWGRYIVDAIFRSGEKHSNYSNHVEKMICGIVKQIRDGYRSDVPIVVCFDSGFFDQKIFEKCEGLGIGYVGGGKMYSDIKETVAKTPRVEWMTMTNGEQVWEYTDFLDRREIWDKERRSIFCRPVYDDKQQLIEFVRPDTVIYTNLGMGEDIDRLIVDAGREDLFETEKIIETYHDRGSDELVHRALKDFASETLPFKRFNQNTAWYFVMVISFFLYESFKEDVCDPIVPIECYATTLRRQVIDIAAKIVSHSGKIIIRVTRAVWNRIKIRELWERCSCPPQFAWS